MTNHIPSLSYCSELGIDELIKRWGTSVSIALLDPACQFFQLPDVEGVIGYRLGKGCAVVLGDPVCEPSQIPKIATAFSNYCHDKNLQVVYTAISPAFQKWAVEKICRISMNIGHEVILNPQDKILQNSQGRRLRSKMSQSIRAGVKIKEYTGNNSMIENLLTKAAHSWLNAKKGPQIYLANVRLFDNPNGKRWFYAELNGEVIGVLLLNRLEAREGWLFNLLFATDEAPNGTTELLASSVLEILESEGCTRVSAGVVMGDALGEVIGLGKFSQWIMKKGFRLARWYFDLNARRQYWTKFHPTYEESYVLFGEKIRPKTVCGIFHALNTN